MAESAYFAAMHFIKARIRQLRPAGKTLTGLAEAMGVTPARITEIMKGERQVKASELPSLASYLEMALKDVLASLQDPEVHPTGSETTDAAPPTTSERLGILIRDQRERKGMSLRELAKAVGVSLEFIVRIEDEDWKPKEDKLRKIADVLDLDRDAVVARANKVPSDLSAIISTHGAQPGLAALLRTTKDFTQEELDRLTKLAAQVAKTKP
jgi:transcriptional regulator with XRE-family HTH domain